MKKLIVLAATILIISGCAVSKNEENTVASIPSAAVGTTDPTKVPTEIPIPEISTPDVIPEETPDTQTNEIQPEIIEETYIGNKKSKKFHREDCNTLPSEKNRVHFSSRDEAEMRGYSPCGNCSP